MTLTSSTNIGTKVKDYLEDNITKEEVLTTPGVSLPAHNTSTLIGAKVREYREKKNITQKELSVISGVSLSAIARIEAGIVKKISNDVLRKLSNALEHNFLLLRDIVPNGYTAMGLFCGAGGLDLGFKKAGFEIVYANDILKGAEATYRYNLGDIELKDFSEVDKATLPYADIILAGIPCQPFSNAGNRGGVTDIRGQLFEQVIHTIDVVKPKIVLFENVRGFLSSRDETGLIMPERIRQEVSKHGYRLYYQLLNASDYGVPQNRYRVVLVAVRSDIEGDFIFPEPTTPDKEGLTVGDVLGKTLPDDEQVEVWKLSPQSQDLIQHIPEGGSWKNAAYEFLPERLKRIRDDMKRYHAPNFYRRFAKHEIMGTITAAGTPENSGIVHPTENRRYSVREIARFQSFPDEFKFLGASVASKYKIIGNAVPVNLGYNIGKALTDYLNGTNLT